MPSSINHHCIQYAKASSKKDFLYNIFGANGGNRTRDLSITNRLLYRLSHVSIIRVLAAATSKIKHTFNFINFIYICQLFKYKTANIAKNYKTLKYDYKSYVIFKTNNLNFLIKKSASTPYFLCLAISCKNNSSANFYLTSLKLTFKFCSSLFITSTLTASSTLTIS